MQFVSQDIEKIQMDGGVWWRRWRKTILIERKAWREAQNVKHEIHWLLKIFRQAYMRTETLQFDILWKLSYLICF